MLLPHVESVCPLGGERCRNTLVFTVSSHVYFRILTNIDEHDQNHGRKYDFCHRRTSAAATVAYEKQQKEGAKENNRCEENYGCVVFSLLFLGPPLSLFQLGD